MGYGYGTYLRAKPRMSVLRGFDPNQPFGKTFSYRVQDEVTVLSGQVISAVKNDGDGVYEWVLGYDTGDNAAPPCFALNDSADFDVKQAGSLVGYSCLGDFVLQTAYFVAGAYIVGTPLTPATGGNVGSLTSTTANSGDPIVGYVSIEPTDLLQVGNNGTPQISGVQSGNVIAFQTAWVPNPSLS